ncbi:hypothetical protein DM02DRAFT_8212 [Periconia macrospinosa]|uniref:Mif2/CENP-C cupin domain-containing protein n=1 Tax=Periconia macrospinosa TaxID=97972 RepID=A0A2V1EDN8_9PLEO|nr:hypothetical protein DM02DRAFT_8212 [Periconia macrospinosa]
MASKRVRENRENQFYDVGVQGRKTGITLEDKGVRDEYGLEPISGIFSSPQKSPVNRAALNPSGGTITESESMEIQESSIPDMTTSAHILRTSRTHFPPPRSRSPIKTNIGSSPRRQSSMGPRHQSANLVSSPLRATSHPAVNRKLDFVQDESSLQETPALSGSGQPRGKRRSVYDLELSPSRGHSATLEESIQDEIMAEGGFDGMAEESYVSDIGNDASAGAINDVTEDVEESEPILEPVKQPGKRGRKRKSDLIESTVQEEAPKTRRRGAPPRPNVEKQKKDKAIAAAPRRSKRVSEATEEEPSVLVNESATLATDIDTPRVEPKRRGRPPKNIVQPEKTEKPTAVKNSRKKKQTVQDPDPEPEPEPEREEPVFKKPKPSGRPPKKVVEKPVEKERAHKDQDKSAEGGKFVDVHGKPISKADIDQMSTVSAGSRFGRGRHLSVFRELEPQSVAHVGRTGRHRVKPIEFWRNEKCAYDSEGNMQAIVKNEMKEPVRPAHTNYRSKAKRKGLAAIEEDEEVDLEPWEADEGVFVGIFKDWDAEAEMAGNEFVESNLAWAPKGINPTEVTDATFKFTKLASVGGDSFLSWGFLELNADQMKRTKNSRRMHMVFHVQSGTVEVKVHENMFTVHRGGVWHVPRGKFDFFSHPFLLFFEYFHQSVHLIPFIQLPLVRRQSFYAYRHGPTTAHGSLCSPTGYNMSALHCTAWPNILLSTRLQMWLVQQCGTTRPPPVVRVSMATYC